jgi:hypothetical protein
MNWSRKQAGWSKNLKMRGTPPMEQEQEAGWLEQIPQIEEKSPIEREQEASWLEQILEIEERSPMEQE